MLIIIFGLTLIAVGSIGIVVSFRELRTRRPMRRTNR